MSSPWVSNRAPVDVVHLRLDFDGSHLIHRLGSVAAKIENHLLQLSGLTGYDGCEPATSEWSSVL
jgi:hypothetical protein